MMIREPPVFVFLLEERRLFLPSYVLKSESSLEVDVPISLFSRLEMLTTSTPSSATAGPRFVELLRIP
jgi:hypothetical protein